MYYIDKQRLLNVANRARVDLNQDNVNIASTALSERQFLTYSIIRPTENTFELMTILVKNCLSPNTDGCINVIHHSLSSLSLSSYLSLSLSIYIYIYIHRGR